MKSARMTSCVNFIICFLSLSALQIRIVVIKSTWWNNDK